MNKLKVEFNEKLTQFLQINGIEKGTEPVPVDEFLLQFQRFAPDLPVTKSMVGRALSKSFLKKQHYVYANKTLTQCYYMNKAL